MGDQVGDQAEDQVEDQWESGRLWPGPQDPSAPPATAPSPNGPRRPAVTDPDLLVGTARALGRGPLAEHAPVCDRTGAFPTASVRAVDAAGLLALTVPRPHGGSGADLPTACRVVEELAAGCASTALVLVMHWTSLLYMDAWCVEPDDTAERDLLHALREDVFGSVVGDGALVANCYGEPGSGASIFTPFTRAVPTADGWVVDGRKLGTLAHAATHVQFHAVVDRGDDTGRIVQFVVPRDLPGLSVRPPGGVTGVRAAAPALVSFEGCRVPERYRFCPVGEFERANDVHPYATVLLAAPYVGIARAALDGARTHLKGRTIQGMGHPVADFPTTRLRFGELVAEFEAARCLLYTAARRAVPRPPAEVRILNEAVKVKAAEAAVHITTGALQLCGARMLSQSAPLERHVRDALAGALHPPTTPEALLTLAALHLDGDPDQDHPAPDGTGPGHG